jgi:CHAT domain-containing protein
VVRDLSKQLLEPLREHLSEYENWMIAPDGLTWLLPFSALLLDDSTYVVERHTVSYLMSGRDLLEPSSEAETSGPLVAAAPNYNKGLLPDSPQNEPFGPLPGTEKEVKLITPLIKHLAGGPPQIFTGDEATEMAVKAAQRPETLVLSTHAFFLPAPPRSGINPLLRCGLAFAGANDPKRREQEDNDGVLTGMEVLGIDLRGTELVILSACQTGMGELANAEGVSGLRQAFHLAGAENVASTLWSIPDIETADLMQSFFARRAMGDDNALALRNAQIDVIQNRRSKHTEAHPVYWAAFTLTKRGR